MATTVPTVNPITAVPPERSQGQDEFNSNAVDYLNQQKTFSTEINAMITPLNSATGEAETAAANAEASATTAVTARDAAAGYANYQGEWSAATGAAAVGESYSDNNIIWVVKQPIADITLSQPADGADWFRITQIPTGRVLLEAAENLAAGVPVYIGDDGKARQALNNQPVAEYLAGRLWSGQENFNNQVLDPICAVDANGTFLIVYNDQVANGNTQIVAATIDEYDNLTFGTPVQFITTRLYSPQLVYDTANDVFVFIYANDVTADDYIEANVISVSGLTVTVNASTQVGTNQDLVGGNRLENIRAIYNENAGSIVVVYHSGNGTNTNGNVLAIAGQVSGTTTTWGSTADTLQTQANYIDIAQKPNGEMIAFFGTSTNARAFPMTVSGTTLTTAAVVTVETGLQNNPSVGIVWHPQSERYLMVYMDTNRMKAALYSQTGLTLTLEQSSAQEIAVRNGGSVLKVYCDPTSGAVFIMVNDDNDFRAYQYRLFISDSGAVSSPISAVREEKESIFSGKSALSGPARGCLYGNGKLLVGGKGGGMYSKQLQAAEYNYGFSDIQTVPITGTSRTYVGAAVNENGDQILVVKRGASANTFDIVVGDINPTTKVITWGTVASPTVTIAEDKVAVEYSPFDDAYLCVYNNTATTVSAVAITVSGTTPTIGTPTVISGAQIVDHSTNFIGLDKATGSFYACYRVDASLVWEAVQLFLNQSNPLTIEVKTTQTLANQSGGAALPDLQFLYNEYTKDFYIKLGIVGTTSNIYRLNREVGNLFDPVDGTFSLSQLYGHAVFFDKDKFAFLGRDIIRVGNVFPTGQITSNIAGSFFDAGDPEFAAADFPIDTRNSQSPAWAYWDKTDNSMYWYMGKQCLKIKIDFTDAGSVMVVDGAVSCPFMDAEYEATCLQNTKYGPITVWNNDVVYNSNAAPVEIAFFTTNGNPIDRVIGVTNLSVTAGQTAEITLNNNTNQAQTGLVVGPAYLDDRGKIVADGSRKTFARRIGTAISATDLYLGV